MLSQNSLNSELYKIINMSDEIIKKNDVINTLLQYGANINHQYTEHNLNTPLHFAVLKHDKDTTKHLLDKNASKEIYNQDKETAENIAKRMKYQDIMALFNLNGTPPEKKNLMSQSSDAFFYSSHKNLIELEYREPFSLNKTGTEIRMHKFKILKINKCPNVAAAAEILKGDDFSKLLNDSTHLFYVIIQMIILPSPCDKTICEIEPKNVKRSFMLQLDCVSSHSNFSFAYKDCAFTHFDTKTHPTIELFKFNNSLELNKNTDKIINDSQYVSSILRENWWLYLRILMLGAENLPMFKNNGVQILEEAAEFGSPEILAALLDLQVDINHGIQIVPQKSYELLDKTNDDGMTPLMIAASKGKCKSFKFLIKCGADLYYQKRIGKNQNKSVSDFAFENGRYDNLKAICENDGYIPDVPEHDISDKFLLDYIRDMEKFHDALRNGDIDVVKLFVDKYPFIRRAYNRQKQSAAETLEEADKKSSPSICDKLSTIGVFLREKGFIFNCESARQQRIGEENVRNVGFKYSTKNINSHIYYLLSKTHFATESQTTHANLSKILQYYKDLNLHIQQLMEVIAMHADLCIVIDMENPSTIRMDQTSSFDTSGCTYNRLGRICIGAAINIDNAQSEQHVVGTIAHEFTHLAMEMLFENDCKPYKKENNKKQVEFKHVVTKIYAKYLEYRFDTSIPDDLDVIIKRVFSCYPPDVWHAELIVRIPEMTAYYSNIPNGVNELSKFYETINIVDFKEFLSNQATYKMRASNEKLNKSLSHLHEVNSLNIQLLKVCSWNWIQGSSFFRAIMSDLPFLSACHILQHFLEHDNLEDIKKEKIFLTIDKIDLFSEELINAHDHYNAMLIVDCSNENPTNILEFKNFVSKLGSSRRIIILTSHTSVLLSNYMEHEKYKINYVWKDLRPDTQTALLRNRITFQGMQVLLSEIWQAIPEAISHIDLAKLINFKAIEIGSKIPPSKGYDKRYYIERSFKNILNFEKLMEFANNKKIVIISNKPGMGKSTILSHLASTIQNPKINGNSNSLMWIVKINVMDLKDMLEFNNQPTEDILLPLTDPTFKSFYEKSMVTLMLDGFDEVNEACQKNLITLLNKIKEKCKQIWISTRPQFCDMLKEKLFIDDGNILNLEQFSEEDQIEFFKKFYLKEKEDLRKKRNIQNEETSQEEDLKKFNKTLIVDGLKGFMGNPLHVQMLSMIIVQHDNSNDAISGIISNQFNIALLYSKFIKTKLDIFVRDKESFGEESSDVSENFWPDHHLLAMAEITGSNMYNDGVFLPKKTLLDIGLVYLDSNDQKIKFTHRTYAEYLAAKYFVHQLFDNHVDLSDTWNGPEIDLEFDSDLMVEFIDELCKGNENNLPKMNIFGDKLIKRKENIEHLIRLIVFCLKNKLMHLFVLIFKSLKSRKEIVTQDYLQLFSRKTADLLMLTCHTNIYTGNFRGLAVFLTVYMSSISDMQTDKDVVRSILAKSFYYSGPNLPSHIHNPLFMSFGNCRFNEFESIWKIYESNFPDKNDFFNCLLSSCRQYSSILFCSNYWLKNESLQNLFKVIKIFCDTFGEKMVELFSVRDGKGNSFLHVLAENWNSYRYGSLYVFSNRLNECEAFELPEIFYDYQPLDSIFVNPNDINSNLKLLEIAASCGTLKMFEACCRNPNASLTTSLTSLTTSLTSLTTSLTSLTYRTRLSEFDSKNLFMAAIRNRNQLVIERVAEIYIENSINNSINFDTHLIKRTTESGKTILHIASEIHIDMYSIWGTIKKCFKEKEELKKLAVNFPLKSCENFLITYIKTHFKADNFDEMFEKLWVILKNDLHTDQIKTLLTETRKYYAYDGTRLTFIDTKMV